MGSFPKLFEPFTLKGHVLKNRVVWLPHLTGFALDQRVSDQHISYYVERARNDVGMIITGCETVNPWYSNDLRVDAFDAASVSGYRRLSDAVHEFGTVLIGQLTDDGNQNVTDKDLNWAYEYAPSAVEDWVVGRIPKVMEEEDFRFSKSAWVAAVRNHVAGGYDGTELKIAHDGLLRQLMSPLYNQRTDEYGGDRANRLRFVREVISAMREAAGPQHILGARLVFDEFAPDGYDRPEGIAMSKEIVSWGLLDYVTSDLGVHTALRFANPPMSTPPGFARDAVREFSSAVEVPVIAYGRIRTPEMAEEILARGEADLVGVARALITDPEWLTKARAGESQRIRKCIGCNQGCLDRLWRGLPITCILNPAAGRESRWGSGTLQVAGAPRKILVIGGGPAGMKTAEVAARRGHHVTLVEKSYRLGGSVATLASAPTRRDFLDSIRHLEGELEILGVDVRLGRVISATDVIETEPGGGFEVLTRRSRGQEAESVVADTVVVAVGATQVPSEWDRHSPSVVAVGDALRGTVDVGHRVVIVDELGTFAATSAARMLVDTGRQVTLVTPLAAVGASLGPPDRQIQVEELFARGVEVYVSHVVVELDLPRVVLQQGLEGTRRTLQADTVVISGTRRSEHAGFRTAFPGSDRIKYVGDSVAPRDVGMALYAAEELARSL